MAINSFKICPECKHHNPLSFIECEKCEADLQGVKVTIIDDSVKDTPVEVKKEEVKVIEDKPKLIKTCPSCNHINKANAKVCEKCNFDLTLVIASLINSDSKKVIKLVSDDNKCTINIDSNYVLIGRSLSKYPYLFDKGCVSRRHIKLTYFNGKLEIKNCERAVINRPVITYVNDKLLGENEKMVLKDGDEIGLGGENTNKYEFAAYFKVVIK